MKSLLLITALIVSAGLFAQKEEKGIKVTKEENVVTPTETTTSKEKHPFGNKQKEENPAGTTQEGTVQGEQESKPVPGTISRPTSKPRPTTSPKPTSGPTSKPLPKPESKPLPESAPKPEAERALEREERGNNGKGHAYGKKKGDMSGREFGQQRSQDARNKAKKEKKGQKPNKGKKGKK